MLNKVYADMAFWVFTESLSNHSCFGISYTTLQHKQWGVLFGGRGSGDIVVQLSILWVVFINKSLNVMQRYARLFVHGHYQFLEANSFPRP